MTDTKTTQGIVVYILVLVNTTVHGANATGLL